MIMSIMNTSIPSLGQVIITRRTFTQEDFNRFAELSRDNNPVHVDPGFAATTRFGRTVAHGMMLYGMICGVLSENFPAARQLEQDLVFMKPTYAGDEMTFRLEVTDVNESAWQARLSAAIIGPNGESSCEGQMLVQWK